VEETHGVNTHDASARAAASQLEPASKRFDRRRCLARLLPWSLLALALILVFSQVQRPSLLMSVWVPWAEVGCLAIAMTPIILVGGIDLSVGSMVALCGVVAGVLHHQFDWSIQAAACAALFAGFAAGGANGLLVVAGMPPLVATLATMAFYRGLAMTFSSAERFAGFPDGFLSWSTVFGVPAQFWLLGLTFLIAVTVVHGTRFGRWCYAIGDNRLAARFAAVPDKRVDGCLYAASGLVAALVAVLNMMRHNVAIPDAHMGVELQAIACVVVGGTLITGGRGSVPRTLLGVAVISNLDIALQFLSTSVPLLTTESRLVVIGILLITVAIWGERMEGIRDR
jgi:rhamnose transport system permease protein